MRRQNAIRLAYSSGPVDSLVHRTAAENRHHDNFERATNEQHERLLLVLPLRAYLAHGCISIDSQACNGLRLWLKNFEYVTLACLLEPVTQASQFTSPLDSIDGVGNLTFVGLPVAYTPARFIVNLPTILKILRTHIASANFLHFAIGGLWGDWAGVASLLASRAGLPFAVWTDRVESQVCAFKSRSKAGLRRLYTAFTARLMAHYERYIVGRCSLGLFHGMDCYRTYSAYCSNSHLVHNIH